MGEPTIPTADEIASLPKWAKVAFAARCARRTLPLYMRALPEIQKVHPFPDHGIIGMAVEAAERMAAAARSDPRGFDRSVLSAKSILATRAGVPGAASAANVAIAAYRVAAEAGLMSGTGLTAATHALTQGSRRAASEVGGGAEVVAAIRVDFDTVSRAAAAGAWTDDTQVPPELFGPLWPDEVASQMPAVIAAERWLKGLMGEHASRAQVRWSFAGADTGFPAGVRVKVEVEGASIAEEQAFTWEQCRDEEYLKASLATLWAKVSARRSQAILAGVGLPEVG